MNDPTIADDGGYVFKFHGPPTVTELADAMTDISGATMLSSMTATEVAESHTRIAKTMLGEVAAGNVQTQADIASVMIDAWFARRDGEIPEEVSYLIDMYEWGPAARQDGDGGR